MGRLRTRRARPAPARLNRTPRRSAEALDLDRRTAGPLGDADLATAQTLADVATAYLLNAQARVDLEAVSATEREALERLRHVDRAKTEFLATVIHELRTPLTSITGYTELLQDGDPGDLDVAQRRLVDAIARNGARLTALADDLLTLATLEEGADTYEHTDVDLGEVVRSAEAALRVLIDSRDLAVTVEVPVAPVLLDGDARHLERLVTNLMTNALKFTMDGGWVRCLLTREGDTARLEVSDNGIGIPEAEQSDLFTRFFRSSSAHDQAIPGSGLGMNIVQSIAENHGGKVAVSSAHRQGTTFAVELPLLSR